jgi:DNA polymerase bacteriophage-type
MILNIDLETACAVPIENGTHAYAAGARITLFAYAYDDGPVVLIDLTRGEEIPSQVMHDLTSPAVTKSAFNATFERTVLAAFFGIVCPPEQWRCTMILAWEYGFSGGLGDVAARLGLPQDRQKMGVGRSLIRKFCCPHKHTKHDKRDWILPTDEPEAWEQFREYCKQDVEVERAVQAKLLSVVGDLPDSEWAAWALDQRINDRGVGVDMEFVHAAMDMDASVKLMLTTEAIELTGLINPNSRNKLIKWLDTDAELETDDLRKKTVALLLKGEIESPEARRLLEIRQQMAKSSTAKYAALVRSVSAGKRVRGIHQFYGAVRTGRFAGRIFQGQNLPRCEIKALEDFDNLAAAREQVLRDEAEELEAQFGSVPSVLATLIRSALVPKPGHEFIVCDFSAIEARMLAWLAGEQWRLDVFNSHGKIYEASASAMFKIPMAEFDAAEKTGHKHPARQRGKAAELGLGYQGGANALVNVGALDMGLTKEELPPLVKAWRAANRNIVAFWYQIENDARECIETKRPVMREKYGFSLKAGVMFMHLPNGRRLAYPRVAIESVYAKALDKNKDVITFDGVDRFTKQWSRIATFGGSLTENLTQAACRDLLIESLFDLERAGLPVVMHVHDEAVLEVPIDSILVEEVEMIMSRVPDWAEGFPHAAAGFATPFYRKD